MSIPPPDDIQRWVAFPDPHATSDAGNPAGVVLDASGMADVDMQRVAADIDYSETAFLTDPAALHQERSLPIRYFSPTAEVPFCGHATIATAIAVAHMIGTGRLTFATPVGDVAIVTERDDSGIVASFRSVEPWVKDLDGAVLARLLDLLGITDDQLDPTYPPKLAYAGNPHPIVTIADVGVFDAFTFDPAAIRSLMDEHGWSGTITVQHSNPDGSFEARNLFPVGSITEDPATGSAAAATGAYLREIGQTTPGAEVVIRQGRHVGRPSLLRISIPGEGGIIVTGGAARI